MRSGGDKDEAEPSYEGKTIILCIGNRYMKDDGVGPEISRRLREMALSPQVVVFDSVSVDLATVWQFRSAKKLLVVDAIRSGDRPGSVSRYSLVPGKGSAPLLPSLHGLDLTSAVDLAALDGPSLKIAILGVEPEDCSPGEGLTKQVEVAIPGAIEEILVELGGADPGGPLPTS
ncbi:MAG TPA: hydrogenase maturation protease [Nitrososphaerales archaeon]|nr:hydrogenase maturation protease [Nitrososphaerales archaeon]